MDLLRIEANVIGPIYDEMVRQLGVDKAREILRNAIVKNAVDHGRSLAEADADGNDLAGFARLLPQWQKQDALKIEILHEAAERFDFNVTRCRYAEMYRAMGLHEIGDILSCGRDGAFCTGYNPDITLTRSQTIMQGATHCDFRYRLEPGDGGGQ